jgi:hypothetical protein
MFAGFVAALYLYKKWQALAALMYFIIEKRL